MYSIQLGPEFSGRLSQSTGIFILGININTTLKTQSVLAWEEGEIVMYSEFSVWNQKVEAPVQWSRVLVFFPHLPKNKPKLLLDCYALYHGGSWKYPPIFPQIGHSLSLLIVLLCLNTESPCVLLELGGAQFLHKQYQWFLLCGVIFPLNMFYLRVFLWSFCVSLTSFIFLNCYKSPIFFF